MADLIVTFTIPEAKKQRIVDAMKGLYTIPLDSQDPPQPLFTDNAWAKESVRRWIRDQVARWEQREAKDAIQFSPEDDIVS